MRDVPIERARAERELHRACDVLVLEGLLRAANERGRLRAEPVSGAAFTFGGVFVTAGTGCGVRLGVTARIDACDGGRRTARRSLHEIFFCPGERTDVGPVR